jgi:hypothetical protein
MGLYIYNVFLYTHLNTSADRFKKDILIDLYIYIYIYNVFLYTNLNTSGDRLTLTSI